MDKDIAAYAHQYANRGFSVLPLHSAKDGHCSCRNIDHCTSPGKHPLTRHGVKDASTSHNQIDEWWEKHPDANIGIATGNVSDIVVVDVDPRHGGDESLAQLQMDNGNLPETLITETGGGGIHLYFKYPKNEVHIKNRAGTIAAGIDIKADGGFIVAPPSNHISGKRYTFNDFANTISDLPDWLLHKLNQKPQIENSCKTHTLLKGSRNDGLASIAGKAWASGSKKRDIRTILLEENARQCKPPLEHDEVMAIVDSITRYKPGQENYLSTWRELILNSDLEVGVKQVLFALNFRMNSYGRSCYPTLETLAKYTSMSRKTVGKHLTKAVKLGWIIRYQHNNNNGYWNYGYIATDPAKETGDDGKLEEIRVR